MKNYIKNNKDKILKWIKEPESHTIDSVLRQFKQQQKILDSTQSPIKGTQLKKQQVKAQLIDLKQQYNLKSDHQTKKDYLLENEDREKARKLKNLGISSERSKIL